MDKEIEVIFLRATSIAILHFPTWLTSSGASSFWCPTSLFKSCSLLGRIATIIGGESADRSGKNKQKSFHGF